MQDAEYVINSKDLMELRLAARNLIREFNYHLREMRRLELTSTVAYWENRVVELNSVLERTDWDKIKQSEQSEHDYV